jgi:NTE family protein
MGGFSELVITNRNTLNNYTSTIIQAPAFRPTSHSKVFFNEAFSANQYLALGAKPIYMLNDLIHFRTEAYMFLPYQRIYKNWESKAILDMPLSSVNFIVESSLIFNFKFASAGFFLNHYSAGVSEWNFGVNIGYLLFNSRFLD